MGQRRGGFGSKWHKVMGPAKVVGDYVNYTPFVISGFIYWCLGSIPKGASDLMVYFLICLVTFSTHSEPLPNFTYCVIISVSVGVNEQV